MEKSQPKKPETEPLKPGARLTIPAGQDDFKADLEMLLGRKVTSEEVKELDRMLSGLPPEETEDEMEDEEPPQDESKPWRVPDEELTEEHWEGVYGPEVAKTMVEMGLIKPRKNSTKSTD
jgi:hypothetical protein